MSIDTGCCATVGTLGDFRHQRSQRASRKQHEMRAVPKSDSLVETDGSVGFLPVEEFMDHPLHDGNSWNHRQEQHHEHCAV